MASPGSRFRAPESRSWAAVWARRSARVQVRGSARVSVWARASVWARVSVWASVWAREWVSGVGVGVGSGVGVAGVGSGVGSEVGSGVGSGDGDGVGVGVGSGVGSSVAVWVGVGAGAGAGAVDGASVDVGGGTSSAYAGVTPNVPNTMAAVAAATRTLRRRLPRAYHTGCWPGFEQVDFMGSVRAPARGADLVQSRTGRRGETTPLTSAPAPCSGHIAAIAGGPFDMSVRRSVTGSRHYAVT